MAASNGRHSSLGPQRKELLCLWYGENRNHIVDLACLVDVFGGIGICPTAFTGPSKKGSKVTDRRVAARGLLISGEMFTNVSVGDLVKIILVGSPSAKRRKKD